MTKIETLKQAGALAGVAVNAALAMTPPATELPEAKAASPAVAPGVAGALTLEESWLHVPPMCKDRTFSFDPVAIGREAPSAAILAIHARLGAADAET